MKMNYLRIGLMLMATVLIVTAITDIVSAQGNETAESEDGVNVTVTGDSGGDVVSLSKLGAGSALAGCGIGTGLSQGQIGAAGVGMVAEDGSKFVTALIFMAIPETIVLFGFVALFLL